MKTVKSTDFDLNWNNILSDYITAVNWSPDGSTLAINSAGGEVKVFVENELIALQEVTNLISCTNVVKPSQPPLNQFKGSYTGVR